MTRVEAMFGDMTAFLELLLANEEFGERRISVWPC